MPHWRSLGPDPRYLAAYQLNGKDVTVVIESVKKEEVVAKEGKRDTCRIVRFQGAKLPFICNVTNSETIARLYGDDTDGWTGKAITLYGTHIPGKAKGDPPIFCIRMKAPPVKPEPKESK